MLAFDIFYLQTKCGDSRSGDMIARGHRNWKSVMWPWPRPFWERCV